MSATIEEYITKMETSLKEEANKLRSDIGQEGKAQRELSRVEREGFAVDIDDLEKEFSNLRLSVVGRHDYKALSEDEKKLFWQKAVEFKKDQLSN